MKRSMGFTLIELLVVVAIVGVLASIAVPLTELASRRAKEEELRNALRQIRTALDEYRKAAEQNRIEKEADASGYPKKLDDLVIGVPAINLPNRPSIYFLRRIPRDPFSPNNLSASESWGIRSYESPPDAPRAGKDVYDIFSKSDEIGLNGIPYARW